MYGIDWDGKALVNVEREKGLFQPKCLMPKTIAPVHEGQKPNLFNNWSNVSLNLLPLKSSIIGDSSNVNGVQCCGLIKIKKFIYQPNSSK